MVGRADTVTYSGGSANYGSHADPDLFNLIAGTSTITGTSVSQDVVYQAVQTQLLGTFAFYITENITFNGVTKSVTFTGTDDIGDFYNTYTLNARGVVNFGSLALDFHGLSYQASDLSPQLRTLDADVVTPTVPEPSALALCGTGLLAVGGTALRRFRKK